jgi:replicative DNA helicase
MTPELLDRLPPNDLAAEKNVLGSMMIDPTCIGPVTDIVAADDFYAAANRILFAVIVDLDTRRQPMDGGNILRSLKGRPNVDKIEWAAVVAEILLAVASAAHAVHYAKIVKEKSALRQLIHASTESLREAYESFDQSRTIIDRCEQRLQTIGRSKAADLATASQLAVEVGDHIDAVADRGKHLGLPTGLEEFDRIVGGLFGGELTILAARPSVGKSALAAQIADHTARAGRLTYFASLEMSGRELAMRSICSTARVNSRAIRTNKITPEERERLAVGMVEFSQRNLLVDCRADLTVEAIARAVRRLVADGLSLVVVDYLGLITPSDAKVKRYEQVSQQTRLLKLLAREVQIPIMVLCQLNRATMEEKGPPQLHHLRESGSIEQDADLVLFIHRPEDGLMVANSDQSKGSPKFIRADWPAELIVAKNRTGPTCKISLDWEPKFTRFECWNSPRERAEDSPGYEPAFDNDPPSTEF